MVLYCYAFSAPAFEEHVDVSSCGYVLRHISGETFLIKAKKIFAGYIKKVFFKS